MKHTILAWARLVCGVVLAVLLVSFAGKGDLEDAYVRGAMENDTRPQRRAHAELLCQCRKLYHGQFLRLQVTHQPDREFCRAVCFYDDGTVTKGRP